LTSSWDGLIGLWDTSIPAFDEISDPNISDRGKKRRRVDEAPKPKRKAPLSVLKSHTSRVSNAIFSPSHQKKAYSCGLDSTVRIWDTEYGTCEYTFVSVIRRLKFTILDTTFSPSLPQRNHSLTWQSPRMVMPLLQRPLTAH
jgi:WD40 repeat protein